MSEIDFDKITAEAQQEVEEEKKVAEVEEKKPFKPDLRLWIPFGIVVLITVGLAIWTFLF